MPFIDIRAADQLRALREDRGLSVEALATDIKRVAARNDWYKVHGAVDAFTLRRIEDQGHCPSERVRLVVALYFGLRPSEIWQPANRRPVEPKKARA